MLHVRWGFGSTRWVLYAAATAGVEDAWMVAYLDSVLEFAAGDDRRLTGLRRHRRKAGGYPTTGAHILGVHAPDGGILPQERGLCIVVRACDELEAQVSRLHGLRWREGELADLS